MSTNSLPPKRWWQFWKSNQKQEDDPRVNDLLLTIRHDKEWNRRYQATNELKKIADSRAVAPLLVALQEQDSFVRKVAAETLGKIGDPRAVAPLAALLKDKPTNCATRLLKS